MRAFNLIQKVNERILVIEGWYRWQILSNFMRRLECKYCGVAIYFDDGFRTRTGKLIPLDWRSDLPHKCKKQ